MKPALEKFLLIAATLAAIGLFVFVALWSSIKEKKTQMDDLFNNTNVPTSLYFAPFEPYGRGNSGGMQVHSSPLEKHSVLPGAMAEAPVRPEKPLASAESVPPAPAVSLPV